MVRSSVILAILASTSTVLTQSCSESSHCPESAPCCSQYGQCGVGAYCLGGCDPISSFSLNSCTPAPVCQSKKHTFDSKLSTILPNTKYLGDPSTADWVSSGQPVFHNDNVLLTMSPDTVGTLLASTTYMWYGNVKARFKTSRGAGVVTAFILLSDVKDEIDFEFVGADLVTAQSNYYSKGVTNYHNSANIPLSDTFVNYHTYEINWTPDEITWSVDGQVGRTKKRIDTWNATANQWSYPQTPSRIQLSLWPAGLPTNGKGTIAWAGGLVDWNSADIKNNNYYYAAFESIEITCFNADSGPGTNKGISYTYSDARSTNDTVVDGDKSTILQSFMATGLDPKAGAPVGAPAGTSSAPAAAKTIETIPGMSGGNPGVDNHNLGNTSPDSDDSGTDKPSDSSTPSFSQGKKPSSGGSQVNPTSIWKTSIAISFLSLYVLTAS
ncbi:BgTH12-07356 [Blumeria graminis f. sp. triticale]|uniref:Crh-like protein n=1 Tax=Blumeria graminis f. sp. triticale TaxID=1689686 RepID=A0A9W4DEP3_BLUGR|nr:BgTH12-07356 [Blumeria graminis f. sp. triticale]